MIEAAIFDMDGLLIDSEPFWRESCVTVLGKYGYELTEEDVRLGAGKRTKDQVGMWQERFDWHEPSIDIVAQEVVDSVISSVHINGSALPGVYEVIALMKDHNVPMAVASSSSKDLIDVVLERLDLAKDMQFAVSGENEARGKPFPDVFLTTSDLLGTEPENCVVFEDSLNGIRAAKAAKMKCIAVPEKPHDPESFTEADIILMSLRDVDWKLIRSLWRK